MNRSLFVSWLVVPVIVVIALAVVLAVQGFAPAHAILGETRFVRLASGIAAAACMLIVLAYVFRKQMHRLRISPEFKMAVGIEKLEDAHRGLFELRRAILQGRYASLGDVRAEVQRILRECGVQKILKVDIQAGPPEGPKFVLVASKTFPLGRTARWLHVHLYVSLCFAVLAWIHGVFAPQSPLGVALLVASLAALVTGFYGIGAWAFGPTMLTKLEKDLSVEESHSMREHLGRKVAEVGASVGERAPDLIAKLERADAATFEREARTAIESAGAAAESTMDLCVLVGQKRRVELENARLARARLLIQGWRIVHLPAALALLILLLVHIFVVLRYRA